MNRDRTHVTHVDRLDAGFLLHLNQAPTGRELEQLLDRAAYSVGDDPNEHPVEVVRPGDAVIELRCGRSISADEHLWL